MKLYLVRHGDAVSEAADPTRPLSEEGVSEVKSVANFILKHRLIKNRRELDLAYSPKVRAKETAEIIADTLSLEEGKLSTDLLPESPIVHWLEQIEFSEKSLMLVGHLPYMDFILSKLLADNDQKSILNFRTGTVVALERLEKADWRLDWIVSPKLLRD